MPVYTGKFWVHKPRQIKTEDEEWSKHLLNYLTIKLLYLIMCRFFVIAWAEVISKRRKEDGWEYYVHYLNCKFFILVARPTIAIRG